MMPDTQGWVSASRHLQRQSFWYNLSFSHEINFMSALAGKGEGVLLMISKTFEVKIVREGQMCFIPLTFDPKSVFGKVRAAVKVTLNGYTYRSTIAAMGGPPFIPLRRSNREAAGLEGNETLEVRLDLDTEKREVKPPADFAKALKAAPPAWDRWQEMSYTHQREYVEALADAKKPETRARRLESAVQTIRNRPERKSGRHGG
jgi:hypothetical protein